MWFMSIAKYIMKIMKSLQINARGGDAECIDSRTG